MYGYGFDNYITATNIAGLCFASFGVAAFIVVKRAFIPSRPITVEQIKNDGGNALLLRDHRLLEYFIHGNPTSETVLLALHGAQTTGKLFTLLHSWAVNANVKIIAPSLPGFGMTSFFPDYHLEDWVEDMQELMKHLQVNHFHVLGTSLGSIHAAALACLYKPQHAVGNIELYVAFAPAVAGEHDPLQGSVLKLFANMRSYPLLKRLFEKLLVLPLLRLFLPRNGDVVRSVRTQWEGMADCSRCIYQPWRFEWEKMAKNRLVVIISARGDTAAPPHNQHRLHTHIANSELVEYDGGHERGLKEPKMMAKHVELILKKN